MFKFLLVDGVNNGAGSGIGTNITFSGWKRHNCGVWGSNIDRSLVFIICFTDDDAYVTGKKTVRS